MVNVVTLSELTLSDFNQQWFKRLKEATLSQDRWALSSSKTARGLSAPSHIASCSE
jgi:hypothetical protein